MKLATSSSRPEAGQAYVLLALFIMGILAFLALALDGGMIYHERRRAQNAADAASLAAALVKIQGGPWWSTALNRAASNGYPTTEGPCAPPGYDCLLGTGEDSTVQVSYPPRSGLYAGNNAYLQVIIESRLESNFAHLVFEGPLQNTSEAVARMWPSQSITPGYALYAATDHDCKGVWFSGTGDTHIQGGSVFSNSDAASASCQSGVQDGSGAIVVDPPEEIKVVGSFDDSGKGTVSPPPTEGVPAETLRPIPVPDCTSLSDSGAVKVNAGKELTLDPGRYESISSGAGAKLTMNPGMYCIYGDKGFSANGGTVQGSGVMIYLMSGPLDLGGNTVVQLSAEQTVGVLVDPAQNDWKGMLIHVDSTSSSEVKITGTSGSVYTGTIHARSSHCTIQGTGDSLGLNSQVICDQVKVTGTALVDIHYKEEENYFLPPAIDLAQ